VLHAFSCRRCEAMTQAPIAALPIPRRQAGPGLLAHVPIESLRSYPAFTPNLRPTMELIFIALSLPPAEMIVLEVY
jgi:hypothetical protein